MATYTKINDFVTNLINTPMDMNSDTMRLAFSNTAPASETSNPISTGNGILGNVTQIAYTNWGDDLTVDRVLTLGSIASSNSAGTHTYDYTADIVITATGGAIATFRYIYLLDDTIATPVDPLVCVWDHGSGITLATSDTATLQFNASGIFTLA